MTKHLFMKSLQCKLAIVLACVAVFMAQQALACTSAIISGRLTADGRPILWKNRDTSNKRNSLAWYQGERFAYVGVVNSADVRSPRSVWMGTNEAGLAIMNTLSYNLSEDDKAAGRDNGWLMHRALEVCRTVDDFQQLLDTLPRPLMVRTNYGLIDAEGGAAYFETHTQGYTRYDVADDPRGFIVRTNFSLTGREDIGKGYVRLMEAERQLGLCDEGSITPDWLFDHLSRSFSNPLMGVDLRDGHHNQPETSGWFCEEDFIARRTSTCSVAIQGVRPGERPELTTMWTILGWPPVTPAVPVWVKNAAQGLPKVLTYDDACHDAPLNDISCQLRDQVYSYRIGDNALDYFNWELIHNLKGTGWMQQVMALEDRMMPAFEAAVASFQKQGKVDSDEISKLYASADRDITAFFATLLPAALHPAAAADLDSAKYDNVAMQWLDDSFAIYDSIQKQIHRWAELGYLEFQSCALLARHLELNGFSIQRGVAGIPTAFIATYGHEGPVIGLMAEYDALPGMSQDTVPGRSPLALTPNGHACGHNLLGTGAVAAAVALSRLIAQGDVRGTIRLFGCPAEEGGGGKAYLVREGCFEGVDAVLDWHPASSNAVAVQTGLANVQVDFRFHGVSSHASMAPDHGRSALDAVEAFDYMMNQMREHVPMTTRIHNIITVGGQAPNIVPEYAETEYYIRSPKRSIVGDVLERAIKAAEGAAMGTGTTMTYEIKSGNYERLYNPTLARLLQANMQHVGGICYDEREYDFAAQVLAASGVADTAAAFASVRDVEPLAVETETLTGASSDVGNVSWVVPLGTFAAAAFVPGGYGHCWQQTASGGTTIGTKGMLMASRILTLTAYDLLSDPSLLAQAREEFEQRRGPDFQFQPLMGDREPPLDYRKPR